MREKTLEMIEMLVSPFERMIDTISLSEMGTDTLIPNEELPEPLRNLKIFIQEKLRAARSSYEDDAVALLSKHLTEADIDAVLAWNKSETGQKLRAISGPIQRDFLVMASGWRHRTLEAHQHEMRDLLGIIEPAPAPIPEANTEKVTNGENDGGWKEIDALRDDTA